ncbi:MAG: energy transducer TonB [Fluviicola sp.]|nr:energy transducer TonB [Fluviicola sp.]
MLIILIITGIIAAISLYDFYTSRSWQMITSQERNDTVFDHRNKSYGAYQIRKNYDKRFILILASMLVGVGGIFAATNLFRKVEEKEKVSDRTQIEFMLDLSKDEAPIVDEPKKEERAEQTLAATIAFTEPRVTNTDVSNQIEIPDGTQTVSTQTQEGTGDDFEDNIEQGTGDGGTGEIETIKKPDVYEQTQLDEQALYPGGMDALRQFIADNINTDMIDGSGKIYLKFVVDDKGKIASVKVTGTTGRCEGCDEAAIDVIKSKHMKPWTPAKVNGEAVKSYFSIPIKIAGAN